MDNGGTMIFEGPEKKLEILTAEPFPSLRTLGDEFWAGVVERAKAKNLSRVSTDACDAYLLSESSLFVCDRRVVMITCGRTTLIEAALGLLDRIPGESVASLIYERKNENFPELQHTTFAEDVSRLRARAAGTAVTFGDLRGDHIDLFHLDRAFEPDPGDATLEILMYDMPADVSRLFTRKSAPADLREKIGLVEMLPEFLLDDYLFEPAGYSFNAIKGEFYTTLHVTPQRKGSYTSFETNYRLDAPDAQRVVSRVLGSFRPARCDVLLFQSQLDLGGLTDGFRVTTTQSMTLGCGYAVAYAHVERELARR
jgi:S-adenosylmethionine decarboxylase